MERTVRMQHDILNAVAAIPGVSAAAFASSLPMETEFENNIGITAEGKAYAEGIPPMRRLKYASPGLFAALGTPLIAGRDFTWADVYDTRSVVIVSENMARETWGEPAAALGKRIRVGRAGAWNEVVGVAANVYDSGVDQAPPATVYFRFGVLKFGPFRFVPRDSTFAVRGASTGTNALLAQIRAAVWSVNPSLPLAQVRTLGEVYDRSLARTSFTLVMLAIAAAMALTLGLIGIYGVIAYSVSQRNREIGIRLALGAQQGELKRMFVRDGVVLAGIGVALGLGAAAGLTRLMSSLLFGVEALDPATFGAVAVVLLMAAIIASYVPARRAAAVDPVEALRAE
jgi:predicted permease